MRLIRTVSVVALLSFSIVWPADRAVAQMAVIDNSNLAQTTLAASRALSELQQLTAQYNQLVMTYQMLTNPADVTSMVTGLNVSSLQNPLPTVPSLSGLISGQTTATGLGATFYSQNHIYSPTDGSLTSSQLIASGNSIANLQGVATTNLQAIQQRMGLLPALEAALTGANSITEVNAVNGRIALEANYVQAQQAQAQNLSILAQEQRSSQAQQEKEQFVQDMTNGQAEMQAAAAANGGQ
jgi:type IV secretion system protein VirB5